MTITPVSPIRLPDQIGAVRPAGAQGVDSFRSVMSNAVETVNALQNSADATIQRFLSGEGGELHQVALEQQKAGLAFDLFLQVRNKAVQAYQEIMRMPL